MCMPSTDKGNSSLRLTLGPRCSEAPLDMCCAKHCGTASWPFVRVKNSARRYIIEMVLKINSLWHFRLLYAIVYVCPFFEKPHFRVVDYNIFASYTVMN